MLMSQPATSAALAARPRLGVSGAEAVALAPAHPPNSRTRLARASASRVDIRDLAARLHAPGLDRVVVVDRVGAVLSDQRVARGLHAARVVGRAALEHG